MRGAMLRKMLDELERKLYVQHDNADARPELCDDQVLFLSDVRRRLGDIRHEIEELTKEDRNEETKDSMYKDKSACGNADKQVIIIVVRGEHRRVPSIRETSAFRRCRGGLSACNGCERWRTGNREFKRE